MRKGFEEKPEEKPKEETREDKMQMKEEGMDHNSDDHPDTEEHKKACKECAAKTKKGEGAGEGSPGEESQEGADAQHSTTSASVIGTKQDVFVPSSGIQTGRMATGNTPSETHYSGKSADMNKSPVFREISKQIADMGKAMDQKFAAIEKSFEDRVKNMQKAVEKFYSQPLYKAVGENNGPEATLRKGISEQIKDGQVRFNN